MNDGRRKALLWRVPLTASLLTALFWAAWYMITGSVPVVSNVQWVKLPFTVSRWTDVIFVSVLVFHLLILLLTDERMSSKRGSSAVEPRVMIFTGLISGLIGGIFGGLTAGQSVTLIAGLIAGITLGMTVYMIMGLDAGLDIVIGMGLGIGLSTGMITGMIIGVVTDLIFVLIVVLVIDLLAWLVKIPLPLLTIGWRWFIAADKK